jgi:hypothetical protein
LEEYATSIFRAEELCICQLLHAGFLLGLFFNSDDADIMVSEMLVNFYLTTQHYITEDGIPNSSHSINCNVCLRNI